MAAIFKTGKKCKHYAGCTLSPSAFGESLERELPETGRVRLSTLLPRALNFGAQHEATARRDRRLFNSCITDCLKKKRDLNEVRHECRGYMRGSKDRRVFPSTFSLSPFLGFPRWKCTVGIRIQKRQSRFTLSLNTAKNKHYTQKCVK